MFHLSGSIICTLNVSVSNYKLHNIRDNLYELSTS